MKRKPTPKELRMIKFLVRKGNLTWESEWDDNLLVESMNDGGQGSLALYPDQYSISTKRMFRRMASEYLFKDKDGVFVISSLYLDTQDKLFELDMWRTEGGLFVDFPDDYPNLAQV
jgi:hypothetical protein